MSCSEPVSLAVLLRRVADELLRCNASVERLQATIGETVAQFDLTADQIGDLQQLDALGQDLAALHSFLLRMGADTPETWRVDAVRLAQTLPLAALAARLGGCDAPVEDTVQDPDFF